MSKDKYAELKQRLKVSLFVPSQVKNFLLSLERNDFVAQKVEKFLSKYSWQAIPP